MESPRKDLQKELDIALSELDERVDRLRSLYEQYFMGYEKLEPGVQRKDVERRFTILRKAQIRNTAQRYRFNVVMQKYSTYVMYWTRICRQIEEGTYKRHIAKAARRFGAPTEKKREMDDSIDVDLGDFEGLDEDEMNAILADADAAAEAYSRGVVDTAPPGQPHASDAPPASKPASKRPSHPIPIQRLTPGTSFASTGGRESFDRFEGGEHEATPVTITGERRPMPASAKTPRQAALPPGVKPRIVVRRREGTPASDPVPQAPAPPPPVAQPIGPAIHPHNGAERPPMRSSPGIEHPPSNSVIRPAPAPRSQPNPTASRPDPPHPPPPESARRTPAVRPQAPSAGRLPTAGPGSTRTPVAASAHPDDSPRPSRRPPPPLPSQIKKNNL